MKKILLENINRINSLMGNKLINEAGPGPFGRIVKGFQGNLVPDLLDSARVLIRPGVNSVDDLTDDEIVKVLTSKGAKQSLQSMRIQIYNTITNQMGLTTQKFSSMSSLDLIKELTMKGYSPKTSAKILKDFAKRNNVDSIDDFFLKSSGVGSKTSNLPSPGQGNKVTTQNLSPNQKTINALRADRTYGSEFANMESDMRSYLLKQGVDMSDDEAISGLLLEVWRLAGSADFATQSAQALASAKARKLISENFYKKITKFLSKPGNATKVKNAGRGTIDIVQGTLYFGVAILLAYWGYKGFKLLGGNKLSKDVEENLDKLSDDNQTKTDNSSDENQSTDIITTPR